MAGWGRQPRNALGRFMSKRVDSSAIASADYDDGNMTLDIVFTDGSSYTYDDVPYDVYNEMMNASSVGQYFNRSIRNSYNFR